MTATSFDSTRSTIAMIACAAVVGLVMGFTIPATSLMLRRTGHDDTTIGLFAALPAVGMLIAAFGASKIATCFSPYKILSAALVVLFAATATSCTGTTSVLLFPARVATGLAAGIIVIFSESWITGKTHSSKLARTTGIYAACYTGSQLLGPLLLSVLGSRSWHAPLFVLCSILTGLTLVRRDKVSITTDCEQEEITFSLERKTLRQLPLIVCGVVSFAFFDATILSFFPLYGMARGVTELHATLLVTIILAGDAFLQVPIGSLADRFGVVVLHRACAIALCILCVLLPWCFAYPLLLWATCFTIGGVAGGLYTLSLVRAGQRFKGGQLIAVNALLGVFWSLGSVAGPLVSSVAIGLSGYGALIYTLSATGLLFLLVDSVEKRQVS